MRAEYSPPLLLFAELLSPVPKGHREPPLVGSFLGMRTVTVAVERLLGVSQLTLTAGVAAGVAGGFVGAIVGELVGALVGNVVGTVLAIKEGMFAGIESGVPDSITSLLETRSSFAICSALAAFSV
ncbi:MAG: hypothetical protein RIR26_57 [Pseudomonadota bacterium]